MSQNISQPITVYPYTHPSAQLGVKKDLQVMFQGESFVLEEAGWFKEQDLVTLS